MKIWLNNEELSPMSRKLIIRDIEISVEDTTASGKIVSDLIRIKKGFTINYDFITNEILEQLSNLYLTGGIKTLKIENEDKTIDEYKVRMKPFERLRELINKRWYWEGISIEMEEV